MLWCFQLLLFIIFIIQYQICHRCWLTMWGRSDSITTSKWRQKMNLWTSHHMFILRRNNWWSCRHRPTTIIVERCQLHTKQAKVCDKEKEEGEGIDDLLMHAVMAPLYEQYWEYLHESFCMWLRIVIIISLWNNMIWYMPQIINICLAFAQMNSWREG